MVIGQSERNHMSYNYTGKIFPTIKYSGKLNNKGIMEEAPHPS